MKILQAALLVLGIVLISLGVARGEALDIFDRATIICLECIGLGGH